MKPHFALMVLLVALSTSAWADAKDHLRVCSGLEPDATRLACYDLAAAAAAKAAEPPPPLPVVAAPKLTDLRKIAPADLAVETHKWDGLNVETSLNDYLHDIDEFRCFDVRAFARLRIDFSHFDSAGETYLKSHCDTSAASESRACYVKIRFTYESFHRQEMGGLLAHMTFVQPKGGRGEIVR